MRSCPFAAAAFVSDSARRATNEIARRPQDISRPVVVKQRLREPLQ
jgi:hypothetical protein